MYMGDHTTSHETPESASQLTSAQRRKHRPKHREYMSFRPFESYGEGQGSAGQDQMERDRDDIEARSGDLSALASSPSSFITVLERPDFHRTAVTSPPTNPSNPSPAANAGAEDEDSEDVSPSTGFSGPDIDLEAQTTSAQDRSSQDTLVDVDLSENQGLEPGQHDGAAESRPSQQPPPPQPATPLAQRGQQPADSDDDQESLGSFTTAILAPSAAPTDTPPSEPSEEFDCVCTAAFCSWLFNRMTCGFLKCKWRLLILLVSFATVLFVGFTLF
ncbi:hypothetical protein F5B19DRAFT_122533 [Rostrohypoxylon terebratum]|nr:hypothetical protein F5B19DRAFT_122533 [Rostrohypoxylon terebratum]